MPALYPLLRTTTKQPDPGLPHTTAISNVTELQAMENDINGNYYLTQNIDASVTSTWNGGQGFEPVGDLSFSFRGTLDGCGYTISNLFINRYSSNQGLFGRIGRAAMIANLTLSDVDISGGLGNVGALAGIVECSDMGDCLIQNVHTSGVLKTAGAHEKMNVYGGLIGLLCRKVGDTTHFNYIYDCSSSVELRLYANENHCAGGLIAQADRSYIKNCFASGDLKNTGYEGFGMGGFLGAISNFDNNEVYVSFCYATGNVEGGNVNEYYGGFIGLAAKGTTFDSCYATGNVAGNDDVGGFVGKVESLYNNVTFTDCYSYGDVVGVDQYVGGFCGRSDANNAGFLNCYSIGSASGIRDVGGLIGYIPPLFTNVISCYWDKEASGNSTTSQDQGEGHATIWFKTKTHFIGWDFNNVWYMPSFGKQAIMGRPRGSYPVGCKHTALRNVYI